MTIDVGTTERKPLTPKQRLALFERHKGICCLCKRPISGRNWIDEHMRALGLGGGNEPENRGIAHIACADLKTNGAGGDREMIDRAKRVKRKDIVRVEPTKPIQSAGFAKSPRAAAQAARGHREPTARKRGLYADISPSAPLQLTDQRSR